MRDIITSCNILHATPLSAFPLPLVGELVDILLLNQFIAIILWAQKNRNCSSLSTITVKNV